MPNISKLLAGVQRAWDFAVEGGLINRAQSLKTFTKSKALGEYASESVFNSLLRSQNIGRVSGIAVGGGVGAYRKRHEGAGLMLLGGLEGALFSDTVGGIIGSSVGALRIMKQRPGTIAGVSGLLRSAFMLDSEFLSSRLKDMN